MLGRRGDFWLGRRDYGRRRQRHGAKNHLRSPDLDQVAVAQKVSLLADAPVIDEDSIQTAQVLEHQIAALRFDGRVFAADGAVGDAQLVVFRLADGDRARGQFKFALRPVRSRDQQLGLRRRRQRSGITINEPAPVLIAETVVVRIFTRANRTNLHLFPSMDAPSTAPGLDGEEIKTVCELKSLPLRRTYG